MFPVIEGDGPAREPLGGATKVENDAVLFVEGADKITELRAEHPLEWAPVRCDHVDLDIAHTKSRRDFKTRLS